MAKLKPPTENEILAAIALQQEAARAAELDGNETLSREHHDSAAAYSRHEPRALAHLAKCLNEEKQANRLAKKGGAK